LLWSFICGLSIIAYSVSLVIVNVLYDDVMVVFVVNFVDVLSTVPVFENTVIYTVVIVSGLKNTPVEIFDACPLLRLFHRTVYLLLFTGATCSIPIPIQANS
jgi:hypothetical protein